jgi:ubiquitin-conjugating enzyme E2 Q
MEIIFEDNYPCPVRNGDWVVVTTGGKCIFHRTAFGVTFRFANRDSVNQQIHHRVMDISFYPTIKLSEFGVGRGQESTGNSRSGPNPTSLSVAVSPFTPATTPPPSAIIAAKMAVYNHNFDDMDDFKKAQTIVLLLDGLPPIKEIRAYLVQQRRVGEPNLRSWIKRISPAALGLLRWIIASNRSCIVQVERCPGQEDGESSIRLHEKCSNVARDWVQFRFAQGAPDKEQRFLQSLKDEKSQLSEKYPTLFAFHGSHLHNWHSIIRHGLDFKEIAHGRAYGNGVYHALEQTVSCGYAGSNPV